MVSSLLRTLKANGKLRADAPSAAASEELVERAHDGIRAAKLIKELPAQAIPAAYFAAYHAAQALFWRHGIRCETHTGSQHLLEALGAHQEAKSLRRLHDRRWQAHYATDRLFTARDATSAIAEAEDLILALNSQRLADTRKLLDQL